MLKSFNKVNFKQYLKGAIELVSIMVLFNSLYFAIVIIGVATGSV